MLFYSLEFALFAALVFGIYWALPQRRFRIQNLVILAASYFFYAWWDWRFLVLIVVSSATDYLVGLGLHHSANLRTRRWLLATSLAVNLGLLGYFKYYNFFVDSLVSAFAGLGMELSVRTLNIILPVGISFYTFQTLSYTLDLYRRKFSAERDPIAFFAYVSFFPQLVAGPIERAANMLPQFNRERRFSFDNGREGLQLFLLGLFKKIVIADNCGVYVDYVFANYQTASASTLMLGTAMFGFQIYGDFSGYSDMARGLAKLFGIELMVNFRRPFFAQNPAEFWQRWHISLSSWFKDYIYIPLGGSRGTAATTCRNLLVVFLVSGLWHGAAGIYLLWGLIHGVNVVIYTLIRNSVGTHFGVFRYPLVNIAITYLLTCFTWIFFRSPTVADAFAYLNRVFSAPLLRAPENFDAWLLLPIALLLAYEIVEEKGRSAVARALAATYAYTPVRWLTYYAVLAGIVVLGRESQQFIYFQF